MKPDTLDTLENAVMTGTIYGGLTVTTRDSKPARLAIIDDAGNIIDSGTAVARECWQIAINVHTNFLRGTGHIIVHSTPPGIPLRAKDSVATDPADKLQRPAGRGKK